MRTVRPSSKEELKAVIESAIAEGKLVYISAYPCPECEQFEEALKLLAEKENVKIEDVIVKVDVPADDWAVQYILEELKLTGAPVVLSKDETIDDFDPVELAKKVIQKVKTR